MPPKSKKQPLMARMALEHIARKNAEDERIRLENERIRLEELERERLERERLEAIENERLERLRLKQEKKERKIKNGTHKTASQKKKEARIQEVMRKGFVQTSEKVEIAEQSPDDESVTSPYRALIIAVMGHVDTGKTLLLDYIRGTSIQSKEAAGITQQIGASYKAKESIPDSDEIVFPGFLFIDTPGHSAFSNLRKRGSSLCDLAIIVIDSMHGVENQTRESINICIERQIPYIIAFNKCDRLYGWNPDDKRPIMEKLRLPEFLHSFSERLEQCSRHFYSIHLNTSIEFTTEPDTVNICPISAMTGEGINEMLLTAAKYYQSKFPNGLLKDDQLDAVIMESKVEDRTGASIDVILINGTLSVGDRISFWTFSGPVTSTVRGLLLPNECSEMRMSQSYTNQQCVQGACGVKIVANNLDNAVPGSKVVFADKISELEPCNSNIVLDDEGVTICAPTIGQAEAMITFLREEADNKLKIGHLCIGNVIKRDILHLTKYVETNKQMCNIILSFDCKISDVADLIRENGTLVFTGDTIYRVYQNYMVWYSEYHQRQLDDLRSQATYPCEISIIPGNCFRKSNPMILGVKIEKGKLSKGTKLFFTGGILGEVTGIRNGEHDVETAIMGDEVSIRIDTEQLFGRHITYDNTLYSLLTKNSVSVMKQYFISELTEIDLKLFERIIKICKLNK